MSVEECMKTACDVWNQRGKVEESNYKQIQKLAHPDKGGDAEISKIVNSCKQKIFTPYRTDFMCPRPSANASTSAPAPPFVRPPSPPPRQTTAERYSAPPPSEPPPPAPGPPLPPPLEAYVFVSPETLDSETAIKGIFIYCYVEYTLNTPGNPTSWRYEYVIKKCDIKPNTVLKLESLESPERYTYDSKYAVKKITKLMENGYRNISAYTPSKQASMNLYNLLRTDLQLIIESLRCKFGNPWKNKARRFKGGIGFEDYMNLLSDYYKTAIGFVHQALTYEPDKSADVKKLFIASKERYIRYMKRPSKRYVTTMDEDFLAFVEALH
jgi:hypothetical protein